MKLLTAIEKMQQEATDNQKRQIHNQTTSNIEDRQEYDNAAMLEVISLIFEMLETGTSK